jgi:hypothetical protein
LSPSTRRTYSSSAESPNASAVESTWRGRSYPNPSAQTRRAS